jgi:putative protease
MGEMIKPIEHIIDGISVNNIGSLKYFKDKFKVKIHGDIGLNVFNSYAAEYLYSLGVDSITLSPELNMGQIKSITDNTNIQIETIVYGYLPSMITKTCPMALVKGCTNDKGCTTCNFNKGYGLKDRMDATFYMERKQGFTTIYNSVPLMVLDNLDSIYKAGVGLTRLDFTKEIKNVSKLQGAFYDYANGLLDELAMKDFVEKFRFDNKITNGHYFRGVM